MRTLAARVRRGRAGDAAPRDGRAPIAAATSSRRRPNVNLSGFPLPYRQGYADGCASAAGSERKDAARFASDGNYRTGWQDGLALAARSDAPAREARKARAR